MTAQSTDQAEKALKAFKTLNDLDVLSPHLRVELFQEIKNKFGTAIRYDINYSNPNQPRKQTYERK